MSLSADLSCLRGSQGAEREAALSKLEKQLMCPICQEIFNKPVVILPCEHNLCRKCANELYQPSLFHARTTMLVNSGHFRCPSCRREVVLDRHGVYGLQRNLLVENIIDVYKQEINNVPSPLPPSPSSAQATCPDHQGEKLNIYCLTCQRPTCSLCKVFGDHQSCQVAPLSDVHQQQKDELSEGITSLVSSSERVQLLISELEETCRDIEENYKTQKQSVCDKFNHMFSILEERQKVMKQQISSEEEQKVSHTQMLVRFYGNSIEANSKLVESAVNSMEEMDMAAFVQNSGELIQRVMAASSFCPSETLRPTSDQLQINLSKYRFNFSKQERAARSLHFIKAVEDVPEEPEVLPEPEEPSIQSPELEQHQEPSIQSPELERHQEPSTQSPELGQHQEASIQSPELEQHQEPSIQSPELEQHQEPSNQNLDAVVEPVKEVIPALVSPSAEPVQLPEPVPGLERDSVESARELLQLDACEPDPNSEEPGLMKEKRGETQKEMEAPDPVKEDDLGGEEGLFTQQAVTLFFYLLAFLIILQRVWTYIGCFICT